MAIKHQPQIRLKMFGNILPVLIVVGMAYQWQQGRQPQSSNKILAEVYQKGMYAADRPILSFPQKMFYFSVLDVKTPVERVYKFTNKGKKDLIIHQVKGGCCSDCVTIEWPRQAIQKGEQSEIKVRLNKLDQEEEQTYKIGVSTNTDPRETLLILVGTWNKPKET